MEKRIADEKPGKRKPKQHAVDFSKVTWDKDALLKEIQSYPDGKIVNWSDLARKYNITSNGGQIAQDFIINYGENIHRFGCVNKRKLQDTEYNVRRKKLQGSGGEISFPCQDTVDHIKEKLRAKIEQGEYSLGEKIVPREYEKLILKEGRLEMKTFVVEGRKIPLKDIRERTLLEQRPFMRVYSDSYYNRLTYEELKKRLKDLKEYNDSLDESGLRQRLIKFERTRSFMIWHDASCLANHGHLVFMVHTLYDPAIHLTDEEYKIKTGKSVNVQSIIEKPELYIVARCKSNDEQLAYVETRTACMLDLRDKLSIEGIDICDRIKLFKGDGPAVQLESGQQKGGYFYCVCGIHSERVTELDHAFWCPLMTIEEQRQKVLAGPLGRRNSPTKNPKPLSNLTKADVELELLMRGLKWNKKMLKDEMMFELTQEL